MFKTLEEAKTGRFSKNWALAVVSLFLLSLAITCFSSAEVVKAESTPQVFLSASSGPTGMILDIKGINFPPDSYINMHITASYPLNFGNGSVNADGTFYWRGPLIRAGYTNAGHGAPTGYTLLPVGPATIWLVVPGPSILTDVAASASFYITDNSAGPLLTEAAFYNSFEEMWKVWLRTDDLVEQGAVRRSWLWGPYHDSGGGVESLLEPYKESPSGWRWVNYYDKARMEVTSPDTEIGVDESANPYYVSNGLLVKEMVTGMLQVGDNTFITRAAATIPAAGDIAGSNPTPSFSSYSKVLNRNDNQDGATVNQSLDANGAVAQDINLNRYMVKATNQVRETRHYIASVFWNYLNSVGPLESYIQYETVKVTGRIFDPLFYATGFPITEAYWTKTTIAGQVKDVLVQLFERRVLTYTPSNSAGFQVEMGNVGLQYFQWRYGARN